MGVRITRVHIEGFKRFTCFDLTLNPAFNVIVGDNETGKSSLLEAVGLVLTGHYDGRLIHYSIDPYLFNLQMVSDYFSKCQSGLPTSPPRILIEAYFENIDGDPDMAKLRGSNNSRGEDCPGLCLTVEVNKDYVEALKVYAADASNPTVLPVEFFIVNWSAFSGAGVSLRTLPFRTAMIDTNRPRSYYGPNRYLSQVVNDVLSEDQRRKLSLEYRKLRSAFASQPAVVQVNEHLEKRGNPATARKLSIQMDMSSRASWDSAITAHLDDLPFDCAGKGEQCRVQLRLAIASAESSQVILIEEPENHLSHSNLNRLLEDIRNDCASRQVIVTTHSGYVLNKLGLDNLRLISASSTAASLTDLSEETKNYFMKLPGYDTLRVLLARRAILVEGASDELIVTRAYMDRHVRHPLADGVDVISVHSLAFLRFLEIAALLNLDVRVVTDNDGKVAALEKKYSKYLSGSTPAIRICYDSDATCPTLEPQLLKANSLDLLNQILGTEFVDTTSLFSYMKDHKTDCALKLFESGRPWAPPGYIADAIS
ncbi:MAG: AAA family ATPase [Thermaerobacter sp.]|nr:AAA family ATPase [Thermaerobacter sp.]